jgi:hypothetical protein
MWFMYYDYYETLQAAATQMATNSAQSTHEAPI